MRTAALVCSCALLLGTTSAQAQEQAQLQAQATSARLLSADPNLPTFGLEQRGAMRGAFGAELPVYAGAEQKRVVLTLAPLFELHEPEGSAQRCPAGARPGAAGGAAHGSPGTQFGQFGRPISALTPPSRLSIYCAHLRE